jgi:hypothetical protein
MKTCNPIHSRMRGAALALIAVWIGGALHASAQTNAPAPADEPKPAPEFKPIDPGQFNNWLDLSVGSAFVSGDEAQFQQRHQQTAGVFGGVEDFHWETPFQKQGLVTIDGRCLFENHDYSVTLGLTKPDVGFARAGYREFRIWYDGSGGFFPPNGQWFELYDDDLALDHGEAWIEAGLTLPDIPLVTFRYAHQFRDGKKNSTIWGDTALTGGLGTRAIVPSFYDIDEQRDIFDLSVKHTIGDTDVGLAGRADFLNQKDSLNIRRRPDEPGLDRFVTQDNNVKADVYSLNAFSLTRINEKTLVTIGGSITTMDTDISGSRIYGPNYGSPFDPTFPNRQERDAGFFGLGGGATWKQYVANVNLMATPLEHLEVVPSLRVEHVASDGLASFTSTEVLGPPTFITSEEQLMNTEERHFTDLTEALEFRYTGVTNWVYYVRGEWLQGDGDLKETQADVYLPPPSTIIQRDTHEHRFTYKYVAGVNWYPSRQVNLAGQYYHEFVDNGYSSPVDSTSDAPTSGNRYPAFIIANDIKTDDVNFRITWRPRHYFTSVTRYDFQHTTYDMTGDLLASIQSGDMISHIVSQSFTVSPWNAVYVQLNGTYVFNVLNTPATSQPGAAADLVTKSRNGYWNAGAVVGVTLDVRTDLHAQYSYYQSDDYINNSAVSTPYGDESREHGFTVALNRMLTPRLRWTLKYGFFDYNDATSGGHNNYTANLVYTSLQYRF